MADDPPAVNASNARMDATIKLKINDAELSETKATTAIVTVEGKGL